jgi:hypothetical protein
MEDKTMKNAVSHTAITSQLQGLLVTFVGLKTDEAELKASMQRNIDTQVRVDAQIALIRNMIPLSLFEKIVNDFNANTGAPTGEPQNVSETEQV